MKPEASRAWQPLTFGGVARYGQDWFGRLFITCVVVSAITAVAVVWTARRAWAPVISEAILRVPAGAEIRGGRFQSPQSSRLAENAFLAIQFDPRGEAGSATTSDIQVSFSQSELQFRSIFGRSSFAYPLHWTVNLSRAELDPWWNAWRPAILGYIAAGTILVLFLSWTVVGGLYAIAPFLGSRLFGRPVSLWAAWKISVAALMPGAIFMSIAIVLYGFGNLRLIELIGAFVIHFAIGWIFLLGSQFWLPRKAENPFLEKEREEAAESEGNPFSS